MTKIRAHGITGLAAGWIEEWLRHRKQQVNVGGIFSEWSEVISGVPQGSVLGPVLFIIYINDIEQDVTSQLSKFADDTKVFRKMTNEDECAKLQEELNRLVAWSKEWLMMFNVDKCKVMHIGRTNAQHNYYMEDKQLDITEEEKDLGVIIQNNQSNRHLGNQKSFIVVFCF